ncbi:MAG TPA: Asr1405/Asl0597 family protein [Crinalium sp.]|jgi:hypothetical protein
MDQTRPTAQSDQSISVPLSDRWLVYQRLQELDIPCHRLGDGSLQADINTPTAATQLWSITFQLTASRQQLISWLNRCW